uniref:Endoplasmic reticulum vesicle transporter C-terminal domain-containing protein n=1 Tax=Paramoeba aestuarina TaxID=180227 RepID=A0A7S4L013_9EUKA|mmetsp:Transcript_29062/g.44954  ORF Transcript_29062/g.44954 Transcript_29062/m.44954 type:complete len:399 (+) Transcript_29062:99-1295(+)|eukprot:CAMPEP_0201512180 /NCGR_PEP_ID=MMETSP0161_2-20130828/4489_1 /ASSEMBLY_ACC=CAM_ASM_000251 /TAXON_ID=180227 /ORGANISM="Neoparamoeba aestuarina, Strain SoJaBio B1-5/56/2" /LENGTH=398 /DNA_ID=CAMNT_0047907927 /DNA_START=43 /DNA_END=1239 /DNA_ORIENTATION=+
MFSGLKNVDLYPKIEESYRVRTTSGAILSLLCLIFVGYLFTSELAAYLEVEVVPELSVDDSFGELLKINLDVTFLDLPCAYISLDAMDISGSTQVDVHTNMYQERLSKDGTVIEEGKEIKLSAVNEKEEEEKKMKKKKIPVAETRPGCPTCYGAERAHDDCCHTCEDVRNMYAERGWGIHDYNTIAQCVNEGLLEEMEKVKGEGCRYYGYLQVKKVKGNFHFSPGKTIQNRNFHTHDFVHGFSDSYNMSHKINRISFGEDFPGNINPLDGVLKISNDPFSTSYSYFAKVVPTSYQSLDGNMIQTNQYSITENTRTVDRPNHKAPGQQQHTHVLPGAFFHYDISPVKVSFREYQSSIGHFLSGLFAIVGGIFTIAGIVDSLLYKGLHSRQAKEGMGKFG